jgi:vitamin B12 transporter
MAVTPVDTNQVIITASRTPTPLSETAASVTVVEEERLVRLGEPLIASILRLVPSAAVSTSGPAGSITEVRIRGAEANHTLLFIDGIRANDPAESNAPRFELLNADLASRIEVIRGPQSALWGSEAIGGVVAVDGSASSGPQVMAEAGSLQFRRAAARWGMAQDSLQLSLGGAVQRARGINNYAGVEDGEPDGFENAALRGRISWQPAANFELGLNGFALQGRSEFDGYDPITFNRADTLDLTRNRLSAVRTWAAYDDRAHFAARTWLSWLRSSNRNFLDDDPLNHTQARRDNAGAQLEGRLLTGSVQHTLIGAAEFDHETFKARDFGGGFTDQDRDRNHVGLTAEWRAEIASFLTTDVALRRDTFNRFKDATSLRASALLKPTKALQLGVSYAEGIAQPNFIELYGYLPGGFTGNPNLKPERSRGLELTARWQNGQVSTSAALYRHRLKDEITTIFFPTNTAVNVDGISERGGGEFELGWHPSPAFNLTGTYAYLNARQPDGVGGLSKELRRPRHSGSMAVDGEALRWSYGASVAYVGSHRDQRDEFPYELVQLDGYWLANARIAYAVRPGIELFARGSNLFDDKHQDVVGYRREGRGIYAGIRFAGRS